MPSISGGSRFSSLTQKIKGIQAIQNQRLASSGFSFFEHKLQFQDKQALWSVSKRELG